MSDNDRKRELTLHLSGWVFFVVSAALFIVSSIRNGDVLGCIASVLFLAGCVVFVIPLVAEIKASGVGGVSKGKRGEKQ